MRIALYHNLASGGALRCLREMVTLSTRVHRYDVYRIVDPAKLSEEPEGFADYATSVHDTEMHRPFKLVADLCWPTQLATTLRALWNAEAKVAASINAGGYDLCFVHPCRLTQSPSLLTRLSIPSLYFAQEARRISYEKPTADAYRAAGSLPERWVESGFRYVLKRADQRAVAAAGALACNSAFASESLYRAYGRGAEIVRLAVDTDMFVPQGKPRGNYVLSVGTLDPVKGHAIVIEALSLLPQGRRPALKLVFERQIPGYEKTLSELAARNAVDLTLLQNVADAELVRLYSSAQATICAARLEPFGLTALESLSCGTPVVAINEGGFRESVIDGVNGLLVGPSAAGIAAGLAAILEARVTQDAQELRATVQTRTWDRTVDQLHEVFKTVAAGRPH